MSGAGRITLGTRSSALALAQTALVRAALEAAHPGVEICVAEFKTTGDRRQDLSLAAAVHGDAGEKIEKGLFTKELEVALLEGTIDAAVHSLKDLPTANPPGLEVVAVLPRANTEDVLILKETVDGANLPLVLGATVATSSIRRQLQLQYARPDLRVVEVRGNVETRLGKLRDRAEWHGLVLARAGLERLGYDLSAGTLSIERAEFRVLIMGPDLMLPAVGQGAIALQGRAEDARILALLGAINHPPTYAEIAAERELLRLLGGGCQAPIGASTHLAGGILTLRALHFHTPGLPPRLAHASGAWLRPLEVAAEAAQQLLHP